MIIPKLESFKNSGFEELFEWASTPRTAMDRSYGDSLEIVISVSLRDKVQIDCFVI